MVMRQRLTLTALLFALPMAAAPAATLRGSHASMLRQHEIAIKNEFTFLKTAKQVRDFAASDRLEEVRDTENYLVDGVSFPYARPVVKLFIERLAEQYRAATGDPLVITSLTRPISQQPRNASPLSVHPTGMAVDLRVPENGSARAWLERTLLALEDRGLLDVTREHHPSHYHVAVFPEAYASYVAGVAVATRPITAALPMPAAAVAAGRSAVERTVAAPSRPTDVMLPGLITLLGIFALAVGYRRLGVAA